jgi:hypothetical protein
MLKYLLTRVGKKTESNKFQWVSKKEFSGRPAFRQSQENQGRINRIRV